MSYSVAACRLPGSAPRLRRARAASRRAAVLGLLASLLAAAGAGARAPGAAQRVEVAPGIAVSVPWPWSLANRTTNGVEVTYPLSIAPAPYSSHEKPHEATQLLLSDARIAIAVEPRRDHAEAVERLAQIAAEQPVASQLLVIAGWPAIHRQRRAALPNPGELDDPTQIMATIDTTAIAVESQVVRFEAAVAEHAPALVTAAAQIAQHAELPAGNADATQQDLATLAALIRSPPAPREPQAGPPAAAPAAAPEAAEAQPEVAAEPGITQVQNGVGELEIVVADDGLHAVIAANSGFAYSDNGGANFTFGGRVPCIYKSCGGDPSLAIGKSGAVYYSWVGDPPPNGTTDSLSISTDNGHSFTFRSNAVFCPVSTPGICTVPDQPHIAADRRNSSSLGEDQVYLVFRNFTSTSLTPRIVCSKDGAKTWSAQTTIDPAGDFPRITVGSDGSVYVAYLDGANMMLDRFSDCDGGLKQQTGFPVKVASHADVACPVAGLDRCNNGNNLSSPMVAVDDKDASHLYYSFATNTSPSNDNVLVYQSSNGGKTWSTSVMVNRPVAGRRFMPWICAAGGIAGITWYDRRFATKAADDLTAYFRGGAERVEPGGVLEAIPEMDVSGVNDPECSSGWPGGERRPDDATSCPGLQLAGHCRKPCALTNTCPGGINGSETPCYFITSSKTPVICKAPETCQVWGGGSPKYGDYNGNACVPDIDDKPIAITCSAWTSSTPPKGIDGARGSLAIYAACNTTAAPPVVITYHQTGACNGYNRPDGLISAGPNAAFVIFGIESIDNFTGTAAFNFDPERVFVQQKLRDFFDPGLNVDILGPFAAVATTVPAGGDLKFSVSAQGSTVVSTELANGAQEANMTSYFLVYNRAPGDPRVQMVKSDAQQTTWPDTADCKRIALH